MYFHSSLINTKKIPFFLYFTWKSQLSQHNPQLRLVITPKILTQSIYHISNDILIAFSPWPLAKKTCPDFCVFIFGTLSALLANFILAGYPSGRHEKIWLDNYIGLLSFVSKLFIHRSLLETFFDPSKKCFQYSIYHRWIVTIIISLMIVFSSTSIVFFALVIFHCCLRS